MPITPPSRAEIPLANMSSAGGSNNTVNGHQIMFMFGSMVFQNLANFYYYSHYPPPFQPNLWMGSRQEIWCEEKNLKKLYSLPFDCSHVRQLLSSGSGLLCLSTFRWNLGRTKESRPIYLMLVLKSNDTVERCRKRASDGVNIPMILPSQNWGQH